MTRVDERTFARHEWIARHLDAGHSVTKHDRYDECSCGSRYWRESAAADPQPAPATPALQEAAELALHEMRYAESPRESFTRAADRLHEAIVGAAVSPVAPDEEIAALKETIVVLQGCAKEREAYISELEQRQPAPATVTPDRQNEETRKIVRTLHMALNAIFRRAAGGVHLPACSGEGCDVCRELVPLLTPPHSAHREARLSAIVQEMRQMIVEMEREGVKGWPNMISDWAAELAEGDAK